MLEICGGGWDLSIFSYSYMVGILRRLVTRHAFLPELVFTSRQLSDFSLYLELFFNHQLHSLAMSHD
jgi:hypothetical protein